MLAGRRQNEAGKVRAVFVCLCSLGYLLLCFPEIAYSWPETLLTWDILFLLPVTWTGPVLSPLISSLSMILLALVIVCFTHRNNSVYLLRFEWALIVRCLCSVSAYIWDYSRFILLIMHLRSVVNSGEEGFICLSLKYMPESFPWGIFLAGELMILTSILLLAADQ